MIGRTENFDRGMSSIVHGVVEGMTQGLFVDILGFTAEEARKIIPELEAKLADSANLNRIEIEGMFGELLELKEGDPKLPELKARLKGKINVVLGR